MNQRTSRLISRYCSYAKIPEKKIKRAWYRTPHNKRHRIRKEMAREVRRFQEEEATKR